jgi:hypothetical protein
MPQKQKDQAIGLGFRLPQLFVRRITTSAIHALLETSRAVLTIDPPEDFEFGDGVYKQHDGSLLLLQSGANGWWKLLQEVSAQDAIGWYARNLKGQDISSDEDALIQFLQQLTPTQNYH